MEKKNKIILAAIVVAAIAAIIIAVAASSSPKGGTTNSISDNKDGISDSNTTVSQTQATEEPIVTPTFVYIVSQSDTANYQAAMAAVETLKAEYDGRIIFDIRDIDTDPESAEGFKDFGVPSLIMLDNHNNPCAFVSTLLNPTVNPTDVDELRKAVNTALGE